ncbi:MAG: DUF192 domain-containing protein [Acidobacteria bacterium]|nr:MAG: DUF192 domain-containing protein [Acidobacteriota bacterium]
MLVPVMLLALACAADAGGARTVLDLGDGDRVVASTGSGEAVVLEVVRSPAMRARGMMFRDEVPRGTGMLFVLERADRHPFWMYQCRVALDIVWLDEHGTVVDVSPHTPPCPSLPCPNYAPQQPARLVIEVGAGEAARLGMTPGRRVLLVPERSREGGR